MSKLRIIADMKQDIGQRSIQQDAMEISDPALYGQRGLLAVLADGIGGMEGGERFSEIAVRAMLSAFETDDPDADERSRLRAAFDSARTQAMELREGQGVDGGATVVAVLIRHGRCAFLSVGDSRIYLYRKGGLIQLNREHTLGRQLDELAALGRIPREEAQNNIYRKAITNNLAERASFGFDICPRPFPLRPGDKLALMSDGIFGAISEDEIARNLALPGLSGLDGLIEGVRRCRQPRQDNYSVVLVCVEADGVDHHEEETK